MKFIATREVLDLGLKVIGITITNLYNKTKTKEFINFQNKAYKALEEKYTNFDIETDLILRGFNELHKKVGIKRKKNTPVSETILKKFLKGEDISVQDKLTELCNIVMLDSRLSIGMYDMDKIDGNVVLQKANSNLKISVNGEDRLINPGEYIYNDDKEVIYRLEVNQNSKTFVSEETQNIFITVEGNEATSAEYLMEVTSEIIDLVTSYCGGQAQIIYK